MADLTKFFKRIEIFEKAYHFHVVYIYILYIGGAFLIMDVRF